LILFGDKIWKLKAAISYYLTYKVDALDLFKYDASRDIFEVILKKWQISIASIKSFKDHF
jgi:hypothetical protein